MFFMKILKSSKFLIFIHGDCMDNVPWIKYYNHKIIDFKVFYLTLFR